MKIVILDLDETLGYFTEFGMFWDSLCHYVKTTGSHMLTQEDFITILDLYPEFLRPNIINILNYLKDKKKTNCCHKMMIYTNNNGPKEWCQNILNYFETKIGTKLIDQTIAAFKVNGKQIELLRTTYKKTHSDLIRCTKLPLNTEICFLDDTFHPDMVNENIYYINVKPYFYDLPFEEMLERFLETKKGKEYAALNNNFEEIMLDNWKNYKYNYIKKDNKEYEIDIIIGKHVITHLHVFFNDQPKRSKTIRKKMNPKNNTYKNKKIYD
jgi:hypothetical protein